MQAYCGAVVAVLNNIYGDDGEVDFQRARGYVELLPCFDVLTLWLLPQSAVGLAGARTSLMKHVAGHGCCIIMDDDADRFVLTTGSVRKGCARRNRRDPCSMRRTPRPSFPVPVLLSRSQCRREPVPT